MRISSFIQYDAKKIPRVVSNNVTAISTVRALKHAIDVLEQASFDTEEYESGRQVAIDDLTLMLQQIDAT